MNTPLMMNSDKKLFVPVCRSIETNAKMSPDATAVIGDSRVLTYAELNHWSNGIAYRLMEDGVEPGTHIGLCMRRSPAMIAALLGIIKTGSAYVPLDPDCPDERLAFITKDACLTHILCQEHLVEKLARLDLTVIGIPDESGMQFPDVSDNPNVAVTAEENVYIIYTSGSTGEPKGVPITQRNLRHFTDMVPGVLNVIPKTKYLQTASLTYALSVRQIMIPLVLGAALVIADEQQIADPIALFDLVKRRQVTMMDMVPSYWKFCIRALEELDADRRELLLTNHLEQIVSIGERLPADIVRAWRRICPVSMKLINIFGQTETTGIFMYYPIPEELPEGSHTIPIGRAVPNATIEIVDDNLRAVPCGEPGELTVATPCLTEGYLNRNDLNNKVFFIHADSEGKEERVFKTGDLVRCANDGVIEFLTRNDHQVKLRGIRVEPGEIEAKLQQHPSVIQAVVNVHETISDPVLTAYIVPRSEIMLEGLKSFLTLHLPSAMIPSRFIILDAIPLTNRGKTDFRKLPSPFARMPVDVAGTAVLPQTTEKITKTVQWLYQQTWQPVEPLQFLTDDSDSERNEWLIVGGSGILDDNLSKYLKQQHIESTRVRFSDRYSTGNNQYTIDPVNPQNLFRVLEDLSFKKRLPNYMLFLAETDKNGIVPGNSNGFINTPAELLCSFLFFLKARSDLDIQNHMKIGVITHAAHEVVGGDLLFPEQAVLAGACTVVPLEYPGIICRNIDIPALKYNDTDLDYIIRTIVRELQSDDAHSPVVFRNGKRFITTLSLASNVLYKDSLYPLREKGIYVITGGLGGLGLELATFLATNFQATILLIARTEIPSREHWETFSDSETGKTGKIIRKLIEIENAGSEVSIIKADVTDDIAMHNVIADSIKRYGKIDGVFHLAGILDRFTPIEEIKHQSVANTLRPKVQGTRVLMNALKDISLDFIVFYSSISSVIGRLGTVDYCAANAYLDAAACYYRRQGYPVISINWDTWDETGMAKRLTGSTDLDMFRSSEMDKGIRSQEGLDVLQRILSIPSPRIIVSTRNLKKRFEAISIISGDQRSKPGLTEETHYTASDNQIEHLLRGVWQKVLGDQYIERNANFFELGGNSLSAMQVITRIRRLCNVDLPIQRLFEYPSIAALTEFISAFLKGSSLPDIDSHEEDPQECYPLSFSQQRMWFLHQFDSQSPVYNIVSGWYLTGELNREWLQRSVDLIVSRQSSLRTTFHDHEGDPHQRISPNVTFPIRWIDLSKINESGRQKELERVIHSESSKPFDLRILPLFRVTAIAVSEQKTLLLIVFHHIIADGWSVSVFFNELAEYYNADAGQPVNLPDMRIRYTDYAIWQRREYTDGYLENTLNYWKKRLSGHTAELPLPYDKPRPFDTTFKGRRHYRTFSRDLTDRFLAFCNSCDATPYMTLLAAVTGLISRCSNESDIVIGSPVANRDRKNLEPLIGFFVNTIVIKTSLKGDPTFREIVDRVRTNVLEAFTHQECPFEKVVEVCHPERHLNRQPVFQIMFAMQNFPHVCPRFYGLTLEQAAIHNGTAPFDLTIYAVMSDQIKLTVEFSTELFDHITIERMTMHLERFLEHVVNCPDLKLSAVEYLTENEEQQLLQDWSGIVSNYPSDSTIPELFEEQAHQQPDAVALIHDDRKITYRALNENANRLAHYLNKHGITAATSVGICMHRSVEMLIAILGVLKAGGIYVPLDPSYPVTRLNVMLDETRAPVLITDNNLLMNKCNADLNILDYIKRKDQIDRESASDPDIAITSNDLAYIMFTSGSTGTPKGVQIPHKGVIRLVKNTNYAELTSDRIFLHMAPISFDASTFEVWGALLNGACCVLYPDPVPDIARLEYLLKTYHITTLWLTASLFNMIVDENPEILSGVRQLLTGGEALSPAHVRHALKCLPNTEIINGYGPTENTTFTTCYPVPSDFSESAVIVPIGKPVTNTTVYILDRYRKPVPCGVVGELYTGGDGLAKGYLNDPELTSRMFIPNPFGDHGSRLYRTGDTARYLPDGSIETLGRKDFQVKIHGFRIELQEIEAAIKKQPGIRQTLVVVHKDGHGMKRLDAYLTYTGNDWSEETIRQNLSEILPAYMIPKTLTRLKEFPVTPAGKIDRSALPLPDIPGTQTAERNTLPADELESRLMEIWREHLQIPAVNLTDDFFELGGHSLLAIRVMARIHKQFGCALPVAELFHHPTVKQLADVIRGTIKPIKWDWILLWRKSNSGIPFFWILGNDTLRRILNDNLDQNWDIYSLQHQSQDGRPMKTTSVEEIAEMYLEEITEFRPKGPFFFGGYSFGGLLALHMARILQEKHMPVDLVFLLDPTFPGFQQPLNRQARTHTKNEIMQTGNNYLANLYQRYRNKIQYRIKLIRRSLPHKLGLPIASDLLDDYLTWKYRQAARSYRPVPYTGKVILCQTDNIAVMGDWTPYLKGDVTVYRISGTHKTLTQEPNTGIWTGYLQRHLNVMISTQEDEGNTKVPT
ncbi:amino acid adenylation domain-containing protein [bacterium]|nr:amino acid adenylation domain-containing protein [candidate division CSSED10-310 bacterium]